jgi:DNA (cytosine-5)-methyltransferase 1
MTELADLGKGIRVLSFFSGAGGLDLGFHNRGFEIVYANELVPLFCKTLEANKGAYVSEITSIQSGDIRQIDPAVLPSDIDLVIGGPPCQTFSASGRRAGGAAGRLDARGTLFQAYSRIISTIHPKCFLFENVRGILGTNKGQDWQEIVQTFREIGYKLSYRILDANDFGLAQQRERMFLVGHRLEEDFLFPRPTHGPDSPSKRPHITAGEALEGVSQTEDVEKLKLEGGKYSHLLPLIPPGDNYLYFTAKRGYPEPIFAYRSRFSDFLYKASPNRSIKTLIASPGKYTGPLHWENRYFSVAEYKRLQGFPDDYQFCGNRAEQIQQIGNSVSPKIAEKMAEAIAIQLFDRQLEIPLLQPDEKLSFDGRKGVKAQATRDYHRTVELGREAGSTLATRFKLNDYTASIAPNRFPIPLNLKVDMANVSVSTEANAVEMKVRGDTGRKLFARMSLSVGEQSQEDPITLNVTVYGDGPHCIQTMWNAVDDWVIRSSNFHSLFELYGHFTEPHPIFRVNNFKPYSDHPIAEFAQHVSNFKNCSQYFSRSALVDLFADSFDTEDFVELVNILRGFRFDVRCREINIAIPSGLYMVAYPFTLPHRKQMNFSLKQIAQPDDEKRMIAI